MVVKRRPSASLSSANKRPKVNSVFVKNAPENEPSQAKFEDRPFEQGGFRFVYKGEYIDGPRKGEACVMKEFKTGCVHEATYFDQDITAVKKAGELIDSFNKSGTVSKGVYLNEPEVWSGTGGRISGHRFLVEPLIKGEYFKFNSNTGHASPDSDTMQALSHFSYHHSNGKYLVCDLQGGRYTGYYILTDPVIHSRSKEFGGTDLGQEGIDNFMAHHKCGRFCNPNWKVPTGKKLIPLFEAVAGTTFGEGMPLFTDCERKNLEVTLKKEVRIKIRDLWENELKSGNKLDKTKIIVDKRKSIQTKSS
eukprot:TRINITY_DN63991_c0_g1_i1.p1 TRINITY_DN63991_c0_g1~~TRINITY_DN63991_c0_g1_i1.p1  ORF type:complete len:319 (-),score=40.68 TRINITY_DN63991_c0_g1_i1:101-1018(-)